MSTGCSALRVVNRAWFGIGLVLVIRDGCTDSVEPRDLAEAQRFIIQKPKEREVKRKENGERGGGRAPVRSVLLLLLVQSGGPRGAVPGRVLGAERQPRAPEAPAAAAALARAPRARGAVRAEAAGVGEARAQRRGCARAQHRLLVSAIKNSLE